MEAHKIGFDLWVKAVEKAGSTDPDKVAAAIIGLETPNLTGGTAKDAAQPPYHQTRADRRDQDDGQFAVVWQTEAEVPGDAWSDYLEGSKDLVGDWTDPINCGNYNTKTKTCLGAAAQ